MEDNNVVMEEYLQKQAIKRWARLSENNLEQKAERRGIEATLEISPWQMYHEAARLLIECIDPPPFQPSAEHPVPLMQSWVPDSVRRQIAGLIHVPQKDEPLWDAFRAEDKN